MKALDYIIVTSAALVLALGYAMLVLLDTVLPDTRSKGAPTVRGVPNGFWTEYRK